MSDLSTPSAEDLINRRHALKRQRRVRNVQNLWRIVAVSGMAAGALWAIAHPPWLIESTDQIQVQGNEMLSAEAIRALIPLEYPQSLLKIEPQQLEDVLYAQSPIESVQINRQLFPPRLEVLVQERRPVAVTTPSRSRAASASEQPIPVNQPGLIDDQGHWIAQYSNGQIDADFELPTLTVRGFKPAYQSQWPTLYAAIQASVVDVSEIDWRSPNNLILQTELGTVHLGTYHPHRISEQLTALAQLHSLARTANTPEVEYIDLSNPQTPAVRIAQSSAESANESP